MRKKKKKEEVDLNFPYVKATLPPYSKRKDGYGKMMCKMQKLVEKISRM